MASEKRVGFRAIQRGFFCFCFFNLSFTSLKDLLSGNICLEFSNITGGVGRAGVRLRSLNSRPFVTNEFRSGLLAVYFP